MIIENIGKFNERWKLSKPKGSLIVVSGPSGVGKGTLVNEVIKLSTSRIVKSVSVTTRKPRHTEQDSLDYFFKNIEEFSELIEQDLLLEYACVFGGKLYGTPRKYVEEQTAQGKNVILEIDVQGAMQVKKKWKNGIFVFVLPPNMQELERRLRERKTEDEESIQNRLAVAYKEFESIPEYDYVIVNDDLQDSIECLKSIVVAELCKIKNNL